MKRIALPGILLLITFLALAAANDHAFCGQMRKISLTDGSVLYGEIAGFNDGVYSVQTKDAGLLQIEEANVRSIGMIGNQAAEAPKEEEYSGPSQAVVQAGVDALKRAMQNNPAVMGS
ncbi:MAG: hypothetical protein KKA52_08185, partial [Candidatus Omnitrophica bacterium]|nr:hypothetical protein [Candidatus Omnitrophota bacterium]